MECLASHFQKKPTDFISVLNFNLITAGFQWNMIPEIYVRQKVLKNYVMCENMGWLWCSVLRFANTMVFLFSRQPCLISSILIHGTFWILSYTQSQFCTPVKVDPQPKWLYRQWATLSCHYLTCCAGWEGLYWSPTSGQILTPRNSLQSCFKYHSLAYIIKKRTAWLKFGSVFIYNK